MALYDHYSFSPCTGCLASYLVLVVSLATMIKTSPAGLVCWAPWHSVSAVRSHKQHAGRQICMQTHIHLLTSPHHISLHLVSPCLNSFHLTSPHLASPHLTSPHLVSPHFASPRLTSLQLNCVNLVQQAWGAMGEGESDEFKRVLLEGNPYFLALTCSVSLLHSVFDFFAFKNDIGFWKNKKSVEGLSVRTIGLNAIMQVSLAAECQSSCAHL